MALLETIDRRLREESPLIQIVLGPRQVGKTTSLMQIAASWSPKPVVTASADDRQVLGALWIEQEWDKARAQKKSGADVLLILDEIQKIEQWSECVKRLWDEDVKHRRTLKVVLSGSSALTIQSGLSESLAGRFEIIPAMHFSYEQFQLLTQKSLEDYIFFGGYPGAYAFIDQEERWRQYITQSIVESILSRDILLLTRVEKPALLRRLFQLGCEYSGQILSYQKALGQLQDRGNTTTLAHYLNLLHQTFVLSGLQKFELRKFRLRGSSPKFQVHNTALMGALGGYTYREARQNPQIWGRYFESAVGAHFMNCQRQENFEITYWYERNEEVDFVLRQNQKITAIEVKSGIRGKLSGLKSFKKKVPGAKTMVITPADVEDVLKSSVSALLI